MRRFVPHSIRQFLRRVRHRRAIRRGSFGDLDDPFFGHLSEWVNPGSTVIDVGAAVGDYTLRLSSLTGADGRVIALEPMPPQFDVLVSNVRLAPFQNITCLQLAVGERDGVVRMNAPTGAGFPEWYLSSISPDGDTQAICISLDSLPVPPGVDFLKIDTEGHDFAVLRGARRLIERERPHILLEDDSADVERWLRARGYQRRTSGDSANSLYSWAGDEP